MATAKEETDERTFNRADGAPGGDCREPTGANLWEFPEADPLRRMVGWLRTRIRYWSTLRALEDLDDRTLADIGMERPRAT